MGSYYGVERLHGIPTTYSHVWESVTGRPIHGILDAILHALTSVKFYTSFKSNTLHCSATSSDNRMDPSFASSINEGFDGDYFVEWGIVELWTEALVV